ncbi:hypothetical protein DACRYDRAFT_18375 [Dacryopinax primogenitus]|uniref:Uncharacterized protein n=1 Tax=Dacryopinax primogenitus (strain DJM 731) TaxID=1858805 RepID=M5G232_DACPD|nr:uncharacterized protein DACRYDRAFT_18375 [Dacryopinax primogenitus]EJT97822.1 hypothetical protein DACRYDRAFT_18375 [Dacryopinax primogenitus]
MQLLTFTTVLLITLSSLLVAATPIPVPDSTESRLALREADDPWSIDDLYSRTIDSDAEYVDYGLTLRDNVDDNGVFDVRDLLDDVNELEERQGSQAVHTNIKHGMQKVGKTVKKAIIGAYLVATKPSTDLYFEPGTTAVAAEQPLIVNSEPESKEPSAAFTNEVEQMIRPLSACAYPWRACTMSIPGPRTTNRGLWHHSLSQRHDSPSSRMLVIVIESGIALWTGYVIALLPPVGETELPLSWHGCSHGQRETFSG